MPKTIDIIAYFLASRELFQPSEFPTNFVAVILKPQANWKKNEVDVMTI